MEKTLQLNISQWCLRIFFRNNRSKKLSQRPKELENF